MSSGAQSGAGFFGDDLSETRMATVLSQSHSELLHNHNKKRKDASRISSGLCELRGEAPGLGGQDVDGGAEQVLW